MGLSPFHPAVRDWFEASFAGGPTPAQTKGWAPIARGESTLLLAPTGSGKTLAAFLWCLNRLMFEPEPPPKRRCRVVYVSPLKALAVDVERNLRAPIAGIARPRRAAARRCACPSILVRTGDTPTSERARFLREPADIVITTPESLYLLLTSNAREAFRSLDTLIVDEIHALVPTKRGAHLALSLERLEALAEGPLQRIGLSATQRPLDEVALYLGGRERRQRPPSRRARRSASGRTARATARGGRRAASEIAHEFAGARRRGDAGAPVTIVDAGRRKALRLKIEVPVEDMARLAEPIDIPSGPASQGPTRPSIWTAIHPRLLELVQSHTSTLIFVNSRRVAERLAAALNELAGEPLVRAHHGSLARAAARRDRGRAEGRPAARPGRDVLARARHRHGRDRPGRADRGAAVGGERAAAHRPRRAPGRRRQRRPHLPEVPRRPRRLRRRRAQHARGPGRGDALSAQSARRAGAADRRDRGDGRLAGRRAVRAGAPGRAVRRPRSRRLRRRARHAGRPLPVRRVRRAAAAHHLGSRAPHASSAREGAKRVAIANGGTIPDRGLYGVFLAGAPAGAARVGELDEEMVFESTRRRDLPARRLDVAHRGHHPRPGDRLAGAGRAGQDAVLEGRGGRAGRSSSAAPSARWSARSQAQPAGGRARPAREGARPRSAGGREPAAVPRRSARGDRPRARRSHHRHRALPRRAGRLARLPAVAARRPRDGAVVDGDPRRHARGAAASTSRRCGPTTGSSSASPTPTSRPIRG